MEQILRTFLLAALGALELGEDRMRSLMDDLAQRGERAFRDARAVADLSTRRDAERQLRHEDDLRRLILEELAAQQVASHASVAALAERISALEQVVATPKPGPGALASTRSHWPVRPMRRGTAIGTWRPSS
jgi:polyhydroxyalkanoate synthesis regulator phasin